MVGVATAGSCRLAIPVVLDEVPVVVTLAGGIETVEVAPLGTELPANDEEDVGLLLWSPASLLAVGSIKLRQILSKRMRISLQDLPRIDSLKNGANLIITQCLE